MKESIEKEIVIRHIFVADDGSEFTTREACASYEDSIMERKAREITNDIPHFTCSPECIDPDYCWEWYFVSNQMELDAVKAVLYNRDATANEYEASSFPCWLACSCDGDGYGCIEGGPEQVFKSMDAFKNEVLAEIKRLSGEKE